MIYWLLRWDLRFLETQCIGALLFYPGSNCWLNNLLNKRNDGFYGTQNHI